MNGHGGDEAQENNDRPALTNNAASQDETDDPQVDANDGESSNGCCGKSKTKRSVQNNNRRTSAVSFSSDNSQLNEKPRTCTDVIFLVLYIVFCLLMAVIAVFAIQYGNPLRLINGHDSFGNICGYNNAKGDLNNNNMSFTGMDMRNKPFVFFFDLTDIDQSVRICVEQCPDENLLNATDVLHFYKRTGINLCQYDYNFDNLEEDNSKSYLSEVCPKLPYYASQPIMKRCIPKPTSFKSRFLFNAYAYLNSLDIFKQVLGDLAITWPTVLMVSSLSFVFSCLFICIFHCITGIISYLILILSVCFASGFTAFLWWTYFQVKSELDLLPEDQLLEDKVKNESAFLSYSIISSIFTLLLFIVALYLRKRVSIVVQLFREAGSALRAVPWLFLQPFITYLALICFLLGWLLVMLCLATSDFPSSASRTILLPDSTTENDTSISEIIPRNNSSYDSHSDVAPLNRTVSVSALTGFQRIEYSNAIWVKYMWWVYIIGLIWCSEFILACQQMIIASAVSTWYFSRNRQGLKCIVGNAITNLIKYNLGSIALGSLIITAVKVPRLIISFCQRLLRRWEEWTWVKLVIKGCTICLACFENCLKYIHHNAYTVIAIQGIDFCPASRLAFSALVNNALQITVINSIGDFVLFLAKCITACSAGIVAVLVFQKDDRLYFYAIPVFLTIVFSYFISHAVISVFEMAVDTLFLCFCEDHNMNDTTDAKNYYAPESLLKYMKEDVVDALAPGRRDAEPASPVKHKIEDPTANAEELIPMTSVLNT